MLPFPEQSVPPEASRGWRVFYGAFAVSTVVHLAAVVVCAWCLVEGRSSPLPTGAVRLLPADERIEFARDPLALRPQFSLQRNPGSSPATSVLIAERPVKLTRVSAPVQAVPVPRDVLESGEFVSGLAEKVDVTNLGGSGGSDGAGAGRGDGSGGGDSAGSGFFGLKSGAKSVVYVVDCSGSMNRKHASQWKTRFGRVKYEMLKSVAGMSSGHRFYIIFFNKNMIRMPAQSLVPASLEMKRKYLKWMAAQSASGETDPRTALRYALKLQPEMIYFLTDGAFAPKVRRSLLSIQQYHVPIHTFVFGNPAGEKVMKQIAVQNRGTYTFIP